MTESQESWTPYHYVYNNPILRTDPDGRCPDGDYPTLVDIATNTVKDLAVSAFNTAVAIHPLGGFNNPAGDLRASRNESGDIQIGIRPAASNIKQALGNAVSDGLDVGNTVATVYSGGTGGLAANGGLLLAKTGGKAALTNAVVQAGKKVNKNSNDAIGNFVLYEVEEGGTVLKVGKADGDDIMPSTSEIRRVHTSERKAQKAGYPNAKARVVDNLGTTTTGKAKEAEAARARNHRANGNPLPLNKEKDKKYHN